MTANEAVMIIRALPEAIWEKLCDDENAAMNLAIEALEREAEIEEKTEWVKEALDKGWFDKMREPTPEERQSVNDYIESISEKLDLKSCEDAVSRQAVLDICDLRYRYDIPYEYDEGGKHIKGYDEGRIINMTKLRQLPSVEKTGWIPVSERLPEIKNYTSLYLVTLSNGSVRIGEFTESNGENWWDWNKDDVIAWMPLPEPYRADVDLDRANTEAEAYPISENIIKGFKEFTELMFKRGQEESEDKVEDE